MDASNVAMGGILSKKDKSNKDHPSTMLVDIL